MCLFSGAKKKRMDIDFEDLKQMLEMMFHRSNIIELIKSVCGVFYGTALNFCRCLGMRSDVSKVPIRCTWIK